ncbi:MAG TPA: class I SAM-dependent methyltransferase [Gaiellaceae bacterium]|nr:class I SAM-dependent methyltransferase [Gaiellaceae bacterium]
MSDPRYRCSFETVAEQYERARPLYADAAVDWIAERLGLGARARVLDLAAGTGKLTRQLVARGFDVVAVEPGDEMRGVLERVVPGVEARFGTAEEIPLPDGSVDAVTVGQAFHWFEPERAFAELRRVLRPGGGFALLWNQWDDDDPLLGPVDRLLAAIRPEAVAGATWREACPVPLEERRFRQRRPLGVEAIVEWAGSTSGFVNASPADRERIAAEIRRLGAGHDGLVSVATEVFVGQFSDGSSGIRATSS